VIFDFFKLNKFDYIINEKNISAEKILELDKV